VTWKDVFTVLLAGMTLVGVFLIWAASSAVFGN
jgi:hypothetical protein